MQEEQKAISKLKPVPNNNVRYAFLILFGEQSSCTNSFFKTHGAGQCMLPKKIL